MDPLHRPPGRHADQPGVAGQHHDAGIDAGQLPSQLGSAAGAAHLPSDHVLRHAHALHLWSAHRLGRLYRSAWRYALLAFPSPQRGRRNAPTGQLPERLHHLCRTGSLRALPAADSANGDTRAYRLADADEPANGDELADASADGDLPAADADDAHPHRHPDARDARPQPDADAAHGVAERYARSDRDGDRAHADRDATTDAHRAAERYADHARPQPDGGRKRYPGANDASGHRHLHDAPDGHERTDLSPHYPAADRAAHSSAAFSHAAAIAHLTAAHHGSDSDLGVLKLTAIVAPSSVARFGPDATLRHCAPGRPQCTASHPGRGRPEDRRSGRTDAPVPR